MKKWITLLLAVAFVSVSQAQELIDGWYYDGVGNGSALNTAGCGSVSNATLYWNHKWNKSGVVQTALSEAARWEGDYSPTLVVGVSAPDSSAFKNLTPTAGTASTGAFQLNYEIVSADFSNTALSNGSANVMHIIRGPGNEDVGLRMRYEGGLNVTNYFIVNGVTNTGKTGIYADADQIQVLMQSDDLNVQWTVLTNFPGSSIANLKLRMTYDLDAKTNAAYITVGAGSEVFMHSGTMTAGFAVSALRQGYQSGNGNNLWLPGDVILVDNVEYWELEAPEPPPATAVVDYWGYTGLTNGANLQQAASTGFVGGVTFSDDTIASITNEMLLLTPPAVGDDGSMFRTATPSLYGGSTTGIFEMAYDIVSVDFSNSSGVSSNGHFGFSVRDDSNQTIGLYVQYHGGDNEIRLLLEDAGGNNQQMLQIPGAVAENLSVRVVFNLDDAGNPGSLQAYYTQNGIENNYTFTGTVPLGFDFAQYRLRAQTINGGNGWQVGDKSIIDNINVEKIAAMPAPPVYVAKVVYEMADPSGTLLSALAQTGSDGGQFQGTDSFIATDGIGSLVFNPVTNGVTRKHFLDVAYAEGLHRLEFAFDDWNLDATEDGSSVKFAFVDDSGTNQVQFGLDVNTNNATVRFRASANNGGGAGQDFYDHTGYVASTGVVLRIDVNLDTGIYSASWRYDNETEFKFAVGGGSLGLLSNIAELRLAVTDNGWDAADYLNVDYLTYTTTSDEVPPTPGEYYLFWLGSYPSLGSSTNLNDDFDGDLLDNLGEYAFGGDPTNQLDRGIEAEVGSLVDLGGTNYILHVYHRRIDSAERGLDHWIELSDNLILQPFTNNASLYTFVGAGNVDDTWRAITNAVNAEVDERFIQSKVSFTP